MSRTVMVNIDTCVSIEVSEVLFELSVDELKKELECRGVNIGSVAMIKEFISNGSTEEVKEVYDCIRESYHHDVFEKI